MFDSAKVPRSYDTPILEREDAVRVAGRGGKIDFLLDDDVPVAILEGELRAYLNRSHGWFAGGEVKVHVGLRMLNPSELNQLRTVFEDEHQLKVLSFQCDVRTLEAAISAESGAPSSLTGSEQIFHRESVPVAQPTLFIRSNCRSGMVIEHPGDVVIFGDVNPGGQVIADGDIIVLGILRGTVHAGAKGSDGDNASILAFNLRPAQMRIGSHSYIHPSTKAKRLKPVGPEIAHVRGRAIEMVPFKGRFQNKHERNLL